MLEFLQIPESAILSEKELESAIIDKLQHFLLELGKGFAFVGRQFRISTETSHFYINLVFYNYLLKCFVLFDLILPTEEELKAELARERRLVIAEAQASYG